MDDQDNQDTSGVAEHVSEAVRYERSKLIGHINRCRDLLKVICDPTHRKTIADLIAYLESMLKAMNGCGTTEDF